MRRDSIYLTFAILGIAGTCAAMFWGISTNNTLLQTRDDLTSAQATIESERVAHAEALQSVQEQAADALQTAQGRWTNEKEELKSRHAERIDAANTQFSELMENGERSLSYINNLESKLRSGRKLETEELEKLGAIASGIEQLRQRYKQPMQEFKELGAFFEDRANQNIQAPDTARFKRVRRLFSKDYREQERAYNQQLGQKAAYELALARFTKAYKAAQTRIDEAGRGMSAYSQNIYALIGKKEQSQEDLEAFFSQSRSAIRSHLDIIELDPDIDPILDRRD